MDKEEEIKIKKTKQPIKIYEDKDCYLSDWDIHKNYIGSFDEYEAMLLGKVYDSVSNSISGAKITDSYTATLAIERAARVVGKLPDGITRSLGKADEGKAAFLDILRQKWVYPNANAQHRFDTKLRLWQLYSSVYGYMPMFYDWNVSNTGYVGPDCWLWSPRNFIPQQGKTSIFDMDYAHALTYLTHEQIENIMNNPIDGDGWDRNALSVLYDNEEDETKNDDPYKDTVVERDRSNGSTKKGVAIVTRYESGPDGKWISFCPDHGYIQVRELDNPHKNGRIPFVIKYSMPLFDSFYGLGDFQRAKPLQFARDGLINFYFKGVKMNLIPPIVANANGVVKHTLDYREGAVMLETIPNSVRRLETSSAGLSTYQAVSSNLTGSLLSLFGTQNASMPGAETLNPSQGKTPAAIRLYGDKEATRDGQERQYLETAIEDLTDGFNSLIVNIGTEEIPVALFSKDIEAIVESGLSDVIDLFENFTPNITETGGTLKIKPSALKGVEYRFNVNSGSTVEINKEQQLAELERFVSNMGKFQNMFKDDARFDIHPEEIAKAFSVLVNIPNANKFVTYNENALSPQEQKAQLMQQETINQMAIQNNQSRLQNQQTQSPQFNDSTIANVAEQIKQM